MGKEVKQMDICMFLHSVMENHREVRITLAKTGSSVWEAFWHIWI